MTNWPNSFTYKSHGNFKSEVPLTHNNSMESVNMGDSRDGTKTAAIFLALDVELNRGRRKRLHQKRIYF